MLDITNKQFGKLTALEKTRIHKRSWMWKCKCECGNFCEAMASKLKLGRKLSCGCLLKREGRWNWSGYKDISGFFWRRVLEGAKSRKLNVNITIQDAWNQFEKQNGKCSLTGEILHFSIKNGDYDGNASLDRIDSLKGYELGNIQWVHKTINVMKWDMDENELIFWSRKISEHSKNKIITAPFNDRISNRNKRGYYFPREKVIRNKREKTYTLINPSGEIVNITNLRKFCRRYNYDRGRMYSLADGKITEYRGWKNNLCQT